MLLKADLTQTECAICDTLNNAEELFPANFDLEALNPTTFSARRLPDHIHFRMVRCNTCGLVRSDPIPDPELLARLYRESDFNYEDELANIQSTYGGYLRKLEAFGVGKGALLEIGCGNGFFLEEALAQGYEQVRGVEPSSDAKEKASPPIKSFITNDIMREGLFDENAFDVICLFQVLDHLTDPGQVIKECWRVLKPGGLILCLNHNVKSFSMKLLGRRNPMIDIEHTYLYDPSTIGKLFEIHGFEKQETGSARNIYTLFYLMRLLPLPAFLKNSILGLMKNSFLGRFRLSVPLGNLYLIARKGDIKKDDR